MSGGDFNVSLLDSVLAHVDVGIFRQDEDTGLRYLSASQVKMADRCLEQYRQTYILGRRQAPGETMLLGSVAHRAIEHNWLGKIVTHEDKSIEDLSDVYAEAWTEQLDEEGGLSEIAWNDDPTGDERVSRAAKVKDLGWKMVEVHHATVAPRVAPETVEAPFVHQVPGLPVAVKGVIDLTARVLPKNDDGGALGNADPFESPLAAPVVVDQKTRARGGLSGEDRLQLRMYQLAEPRPAVLHTITRGGKETAKNPAPPKVVEEEALPVPPADVTLRKLRRVVVRIALAHKLYGPDEPWDDGITHPWACGYCGFREGCFWWQT